MKECFSKELFWFSENHNNFMYHLFIVDLEQLKLNMVNKISTINEKGGFLSEEELKRNNLILLVSISFLVFFYAFIIESDLNNWIFDILLSALILSGITSLNFRKKKFVRLSYFSSVTLLLLWIDHFVYSLETRIISFVVLTLFLIYITYSMITNVAGNKKVTKVILLNAINSYLLLGLIASFLFILTDASYHLFFNMSDSIINFTYTNEPKIYDYIYFSFITLTTVGYGDATPVVPIARSMAMMVSLSGQLYLTILVAMLVGKYLSKNS